MPTALNVKIYLDSQDLRVDDLIVFGKINDDRFFTLSLGAPVTMISYVTVLELGYKLYRRAIIHR